MPKDDNLLQLIGKKKKKKGPATPTTNPYWTAMTSNPKKGNPQNSARPQELKVVTQTQTQANKPQGTNQGAVPGQSRPQNVPGPNWQLNTPTNLRPALMPTPSVPRLPIPRMQGGPVSTPLINLTPANNPLLKKPNIRPRLPDNIVTTEVRGKSPGMKKLTRFFMTQVKEQENQSGNTTNPTSTDTKNDPDSEPKKPTPAQQSNPMTPMNVGNPQPKTQHLFPSYANPGPSTNVGQQQKNAGGNMNSFPKEAPPPRRQGPKHSWSSGGPLQYSYPKGIPKSFLKAQMQNVDSTYGQSEAREWSTNDVYNFGTNDQVFVQTQDQQEPVAQPYSPSDVYEAESAVGDAQEDEESPDKNQTGQKRLSAFHRLGPLSQPKKPKLTINLLYNKDSSVREVIDETEATEKYKPVHLRKDVTTSIDEIVMKYLVFWPWKKHLVPRRTATVRHSKTVMILEQEQMEEYYDSNNHYCQMTIKGYPKSWNKEDVFDALLDALKGKCLIPCFIEFTEHECKFLVLRCRSALLWVHKIGFLIHKDDVELTISISMIDLSLNHIDFIPRIVLRKKIMSACTDEKKLNLSAFTLASDISHFIYFPLSKITNQTELVEMKSIRWELITDLDLSRNKITTLDGFYLPRTTPRLKRLNLSHNLIQKLMSLLPLRALPLTAIWLDGNPLCYDYTDPELYVKVIRMMFPCVREIDDTKVVLRGDQPSIKRNYSPSDAVEIVDKFLEVYFPLMETTADQRYLVQAMYEEEATMTITYDNRLRNSPLSKYFRNLYMRTRDLMEGNMDAVKGASTIANLINNWPKLEHDPFTFTVDVMYHDDNSTIFRVGGVLKLISESLADDEQLVSFVRTFVLRSVDGVEYKIVNELVFFGKVPEDIAQDAFKQTTTNSSKNISPKLDAKPDEEHKEEFVKIFMKLTTLNKKASTKCLEEKEWHLGNALEHFAKLLRLDDIGSLLE